MTSGWQVYSGPLGNPLQMELRSSKRLYERNILLAQSEGHKGKEKVPTPGQSHVSRLENFKKKIVNGLIF